MRVDPIREGGRDAAMGRQVMPETLRISSNCDLV